MCVKFRFKFRFFDYLSFIEVNFSPEEDVFLVFDISGQAVIPKKGFRIQGQ